MEHYLHCHMCAVNCDDFTFLLLFSKRRPADYAVVIPVLDTYTLNGGKANLWAV